MENITIKNSGDFKLTGVSFSALLDAGWEEDNNHCIEFYIGIEDYPERLHPVIDKAIEERKANYLKKYGDNCKWSNAGIYITYLTLKIDISFDKTVKTNIYVGFNDKENDSLDTQTSDISVDLAEFGIDKLSLLKELKQCMFEEFENKFF